MLEALGSSDSLAPLAQGLRSGEIDLHQHLEALEMRFQKREPEIQAFVEEEDRFQRLHAEAERLLADFPETEARPALFGVPVGVKDIFHVDGFVTKAGAEPPTDVLQGPEAESVFQLKRAGALILGKTVTTEFGYFAPGPTRNPHHREHTPGGSSSGSAAAVAAGLTSLALGSQTIGSIIRPAAYCGVVGYKPSYGRISRVGIIPLAPSVDHIGLLTTSLEGVRLAVSQLVYEWRADAGAARPVLGVPEGPYLQHAEQEGILHFRRVLHWLEERGFVVRPVPALEEFNKIRNQHKLIVCGEAARVHEKWFSEYLERYDPTTLELIRHGNGISDEELTEARDSRLILRSRLARRMDQHGLDLWIAPGAPGTAPRGLETTGDPIMNLPWSHSGLPAISLPAGRNDRGLPLGIQLVGRWHRDEEMLAHAAFVERALEDLQDVAVVGGEVGELKVRL